MTMTDPKPTVLVIDDEVQIRRLLRITLEAAGYIRHGGRDRPGWGSTRPRQGQPDAIVLDLGLPDLERPRTSCASFANGRKVPVLVLTVLAAEADKVAALDAGADDYLTKPFGSAELTARLRAILRRSGENEPSVVKFGDIEMDLAARIVRRGGAEVRLTAKEYAMLRLLVIHRGKVVTMARCCASFGGPRPRRTPITCACT
jgi:two-component system KDP operon response regulator KdpE